MAPTQPWLSRESAIPSSLHKSPHTDFHFRVHFRPPVNTIVFKDSTNTWTDAVPFPTDLPKPREFIPPSFEYPQSKRPNQPGLNLPRKSKMVKKRRSLQSILIPSFLSAPTSPTTPSFAVHQSALAGAARNRSFSLAVHPTAADKNSVAAQTSSRDSPPPDFLLGDDPFANLSTKSAAALPLSTSIEPTSPTSIEAPSLSDALSLKVQPRSPLTPNSPDAKPAMISSPKAALTPGISRTLSGRARPAYKKPAFPSRPSLPSLHTLANMNVVLTKKVRKGRVGAKLPFEPWDNLNDLEKVGESSNSQVKDPGSGISTDSPIADKESEESSESTLDEVTPTVTMPPQPDFISGFDVSFLNFADDDERGIDLNGLSSLDPSQEPSSRSALLGANAALLELTSPDSLTRVGSPTSTTSIESSGINQWNNTFSSTESDSDVLSSPPAEDYFSPTTHQTFRTPSDDMHWYSHFDLLHFEDNAIPIKFPSFYAEDEFEPEYLQELVSSEDTLHPSPGVKEDHSGESEACASDDAICDADGREGYGSRSRGLSDGADQSTTIPGGFSGGYPNGGTRRTGYSRRGAAGGDDDDGDDERRPRRAPFSQHSETDASTSDESENEADDEHRDASALTHRSSDDDDVPLAQRIPNALQAQRTIRRQVREEREQRRRERALTGGRAESVRSRQTTLRPAGTGESVPPFGIASTQEAALHASQSFRRPRTRTLPSSEMRPFPPDELARRLRSMEVDRPNASMSPPPLSRVAAPMPIPKPSDETPVRPQSAGRAQGFSQSPPMSPPMPSSRTLRPMRSFHQPEKKRMDDVHAVPLPHDAEQKLGRSLTHGRARDDSHRSQRAVNSQTYAAAVPVDDLLSRANTTTRRSEDELRKAPRAYAESKSTRTSLELVKPSQTSLQRPSTEQGGTSQAISRGPVTQQRVFIGDMQRFNTIEIDPTTNAGDVIDMVEAQGSLKGWVGSGGWMLWEVAQDFGMERPVRTFELLSDIQASWNKDKMLNTFILKLTPLASLLSRSALPSSSPMFSGYVEWEAKRGKWSKRWLQLKEHSLWLSKRDNGRDGVCLCSLSNFDAYFVTRAYKAPKQFTFAVKSTDNISFFENAADYLHVFSCGQKEGSTWMERILLARSYVLHQERNVLFNPKASNGNAAGSSLARSGTRKTAARPAQPLVSVAPPFSASHQLPSNNVFEPGSLLHKQH